MDGKRIPVLRISQFGLPIGVAELEGNRVARLLIVSEQFRTAEGAGVGTRAAELQRLYGPGRLSRADPGVCATFDRIPGLAFCFPSARSAGRVPPDWRALVGKNPRVQLILVTGEPSR